MRFMIMVRATAQSETGGTPDPQVMLDMAAYHEALSRAGVLLDAAGLKPSSAGWRIQHEGGQRRLLDGPFTESKELIAGYTLIQVRSRDEALEWSRRFPAPFRHVACQIEVRQLFEPEDFEALAAANPKGN